MTTSAHNPASSAELVATQFSDRCVAVTRSSSPHPADWGRAISLALEYLAVQVAFTEREPEPGILIGHDVRLRFEANGGGVVITAELDQPPISLSGTGIDAEERLLRDSIGYDGTFGTMTEPAMDEDSHHDRHH